MTIWQLFATGKNGPLHLGMRAGEARAAFGEPDDHTSSADGQPAILRYDEIELHFHEDALWLIYSESLRPPSSTSTFVSERLELAPHEFLWPIDLDDVASQARSNGLQATVGHDQFGDPQLTLGLAAITVAEQTLLVSVSDHASPTTG